MKKIKECKHKYQPMETDSVTVFTEYTPSLEVKYIYHFYCIKCLDMEDRSNGWHRA